MRVSLNAIDICSPEDPTVQNFLANVTMPAEDIVSFIPLGENEEWTVRMLRHKIQKAYFINESIQATCQVRGRHHLNTWSQFLKYMNMKSRKEILNCVT